MDTSSSSGISFLVLLVFSLCTSVLSSQLYLQPTTNDHAYFTGDNFFITCFTTDENIEKLKWSDFDGNAISEEEGRIHVQPAEGIQMGLRLVFTNVEKEDAGVYTCSDDSDSVNFELVVYRAVSFSDTPRVQHLPEGETGPVICNVRSDPKPVVNWYFKGQKIKTDSKYVIQENHSLKIHNLTREDAGEYKCKAFVITPLGSQVKDFDITLHIQYAPEILGDHKLTTYAGKGAKKNLICNVTAVPAPMFEWLFGGIIIHNNSDNAIIHNTENSSVLQIIMDSEDRQGEYVCRASNALGEKEVIIDLIEGETPKAPVLKVVGQDKDIVKLSITSKEDERDSKEDDGKYLEVTGYKVDYRLADGTWDLANSVEFTVGEQYQLKNISFNSDYIFRAAARNVAGYGNYSDEIEYTTPAPEAAEVTSSAAEMLSSLVVLLISIFLISIL